MFLSQLEKRRRLSRFEERRRFSRLRRFSQLEERRGLSWLKRKRRFSWERRGLSQLKRRRSFLQLEEDFLKVSSVLFNNFINIFLFFLLQMRLKKEVLF